MPRWPAGTLPLGGKAKEEASNADIGGGGGRIGRCGEGREERPRMRTSGWGGSVAVVKEREGWSGGTLGAHSNIPACQHKCGTILLPVAFKS